MRAEEEADIRLAIDRLREGLERFRLTCAPDLRPVINAAADMLDAAAEALEEGGLARGKEITALCQNAYDILDRAGLYGGQAGTA